MGDADDYRDDDGGDDDDDDEAEAIALAEAMDLNRRLRELASSQSAPQPGPTQPRDGRDRHRGARAASGPTGVPSTLGSHLNAKGQVIPAPCLQEHRKKPKENYTFTARQVSQHEAR